MKIQKDEKEMFNSCIRIIMNYLGGHHNKVKWKVNQNVPTIRRVSPTASPALTLRLPSHHTSYQICEKQGCCAEQSRTTVNLESRLRKV